ncbi:MAG: HDOD domain-containing protein [Sulfuricellaceae bacterium]|jgi:HD-like signal output (HDOD) protein
MSAKQLSPDEQKQFDELLKNGIQIPPRPSILAEIEKLLNSAGNNTNAIAKLIGQDTGLCAVVFKVVNSPFYGLSRPVDNISKALVVLGINQVVNIVKGIALRQAIGGQEAVYEKFWERSGDIAALSSIIAGKVISACNISPDQAYMAGLFHECGVPILMQRFPDYCKAFRLGEGNNWPDFREEDRRFNTDHTVVGFLVARHWNLPDFVCQAVRFHHDRLHVDHSALTLVSILQMARHLYHKISGLAETQWDEMRDQVLQELGLGLDGLTEFEEEIVDIFRQEN